MKSKDMRASLSKGSDGKAFSMKLVQGLDIGQDLVLDG